MKRYLLLFCFSLTALSGCSFVAPPSDSAQLTQQVTAAEVAFAKTMADRDHAAFDLAPRGAGSLARCLRQRLGRLQLS